MKTIKLIMVKGEIDTSSFNQSKFPNREDVIQKIAQKLKKPISEIRKMKSLVDSVMQQKIDAFIDTKIVKDMDFLIIQQINNSKFVNDNDFHKRLCKLYSEDFLNKIDEAIGEKQFNGWQNKTTYDIKTKTFNVNLSYKNRIAYEMYDKYVGWYGSNAWYNAIRENRKINKDLLSNAPKYVKNWLTNDGKKEIELIEKLLENIGKIKIEVYNGKNKKLDTFYVKYQRTNLTFNIPNYIKLKYKL